MTSTSKATATNNSLQFQSNTWKFGTLANCKIKNNAIMSQGVTNTLTLIHKFSATHALDLVTKIEDALKAAVDQKNTGLNIGQKNAAEVIQKSKANIVTIVQTQMQSIAESQTGNNTGQAQTNLFTADLCTGSDILNNPVMFQRVFNKQLLVNTMNALVQANICSQKFADLVSTNVQANSNTLADLLFGGGPMSGFFMLALLALIAYLAYQFASKRSGK